MCQSTSNHYKAELSMFAAQIGMKNGIISEVE